MPCPYPVAVQSPTISVATVLARLGPVQRRPLPLGNKPDPFDETIYILLTVMTRSQPRIDRAYEALRAAVAGDWLRLADLDEDVLGPILSPLGFATRRGEQLRGVARHVALNHDGSLDFLASLDDEAAIDALCQFPGVGVKTAKCILMYSLNREVLPVDIHVLRVAKRLGLVEHESSWAAVDRHLEAVVPGHLKFDAHVQLVRHGRDVCKSRGALCQDCVLADLCPAGPVPPNRRSSYV